MTSAFLFSQVPIEHKVEELKPTKIQFGVDQNVVNFNHSNSVFVSGDSSFDVDAKATLERDRLLIQREFVSLQRHREVVPRENRNTTKETLRQVCLQKLSAEECEAVIWIVDHESGFNQYARNGNCCGLGQRLNNCSEEYFNNLQEQINDTLDYIIGRYKTPLKAKQFWISHQYY